MPHLCPQPRTFTQPTAPHSPHSPHSLHPITLLHPLLTPFPPTLPTLHPILHHTLSLPPIPQHPSTPVPLPIPALPHPHGPDPGCGCSGAQWGAVGTLVPGLTGCCGRSALGGVGGFGLRRGQGQGPGQGSPCRPPNPALRPTWLQREHGDGHPACLGGGGGTQGQKGRHQGHGVASGGGGPLHVARGPPEPNGEGDLAVGGGRGGGRAVPIAAASKAAGDPRAHSCALPASPHLLPASFQYELPPPGTFPREAPPPCAHLHTGPASDASSPAPFAARPHLLAHRLPAGHAHLFCIQSPPLPARLRIRNALICIPTAPPPPPPICIQWPRPPVAPPTWGPCAAPSAQTNCTKSLSESCPWW